MSTKVPSICGPWWVIQLGPTWHKGPSRGEGGSWAWYMSFVQILGLHRSMPNGHGAFLLPMARSYWAGPLSHHSTSRILITPNPTSLTSAPWPTDTWEERAFGI